MESYSDIILKAEKLFSHLSEFDGPDKINLLNDLRLLLHQHSPFKSEPVDCVLWVKNNDVKANDYNPNKVAPPEMKLLEHSIREDGYTQPIVTFDETEKRTVIDGFHRHRVGSESEEIKSRVLGYLPVVTINEDRTERNNRIASTIRHNRARGKHLVDSMSDIIIELKNRNWKNERIARELGMEEDEILRLCQITGLAELFSDDEFSKSWDIEKNEEPDFVPLDEFEDFAENEKCKVVNTSDEKRIFHTWDKWECYKAGFYATQKDGMNKDECEKGYADFLSNIELFSEALEHVITEWKMSCEHYLTNASMNRIAYLGQAACCYSTGIPSKYCSGFYILTEEQQEKANNTALIYLNKWLENNGHEVVSLEQAIPTRQSTIY